MRCGNALQFFQRLHAALRLRGFRSFRFESCDERFQMFDRALLFLERALLYRQFDCALCFEAHVVASVEFEFCRRFRIARIEKQNLIRHPINEIAIMGDDE